MPLQSTRTLDQQIRRAEHRHHEIEIKIEGLLDNLGCDHDAEPGTLQIARFFTCLHSEFAQYAVLDTRAFYLPEAGVEQDQIILVKYLPQCLVSVLSLTNGVADDGRRALTSKSRLQLFPDVAPHRFLVRDGSRFP